MQLKKSFPGRFESLAEIAVFVKTAAHQAGLDEKATYEVELASDEAASNIIEHAYGGENVGDIHCLCVISPSELKITFHDQGGQFDPAAIPTPDLSLDPGERDSGGVGLFIIRNVMDAVEFQFTTQGNYLTLVKKIQ